MTTKRSPHQIRRTTLCQGHRPDYTTFGLTEARRRIRAIRHTATDFRTYTTTNRAGDTIHIAYARWEKGSRARLPFEVVELWEVPTDAALDHFGLAPVGGAR